MTEEVFKFRIAFGFNLKGRVKTKILIVEAESYSDAKKKLEAEYGTILISSFERVKQ